MTLKSEGNRNELEAKMKSDDRKLAWKHRKRAGPNKNQSDNRKLAPKQETCRPKQKPKWRQKTGLKTGNVHAQTKTKVTTENWPKNIGNMQAHTKTKAMTDNWPENKGNVQAQTKTKTTTEIGLKTQETCRPKQKLKWQQKTGPKA